MGYIKLRKFVGTSKYRNYTHYLEEVVETDKEYLDLGKHGSMCYNKLNNKFSFAEKNPTAESSLRKNEFKEVKIITFKEAEKFASFVDGLNVSQLLSTRRYYKYVLKTLRK